MRIKNANKSEIPLFERALEFVQFHHYIETIPTITVRPFNTRTGDYGVFKPDKGIYIYRSSAKLDTILVHELIHAKQYKGGKYKSSPIYKYPHKPCNKREKYLLDPLEVEAWTWANIYSHEVYDEDCVVESEYRNLGIVLDYSHF